MSMKRHSEVCLICYFRKHFSVVFLKSLVNKSHIELELLRLCVSYLFGSFAEMLLPVTVRCSLWSQKQYIVLGEFLRAQYSLQKMYVFIITLYCANFKSYAIFKAFTVDYDKEFFNGLFRVVVKHRG